MPQSGITETSSGAESVDVVHWSDFWECFLEAYKEMRNMGIIGVSGEQYVIMEAKNTKERTIESVERKSMNSIENKTHNSRRESMNSIENKAHNISKDKDPRLSGK